MTTGLDGIPSVVPGVVWPAFPDAERARVLAAQWQQSHPLPGEPRLATDTALLLALQWQLERAQWSSPQQIRARQLAQLDALLAHAWNEVPFYRSRLEQAGYDGHRPLTWEVFHRIPILRRTEIQTAGPSLHARTWPRAHGNAYRESTSGSTAEPIEFAVTDVVKVLWHAFTLREHLWHGRDFRGRLASIRSAFHPGEWSDWGPPAALVCETGPASGLRVSEPVPAQAAWLLERDPEYLLTYPSNLAALAREFIDNGRRLTRLRETRTFGERLPADLRAVVHRAWGVPVVDVYSAQEVGYIALQCPQHDHYHVQSEAVLVEVLDTDGNPCRAGAIGRVVVTSLHNFATPFIRYDLGDYAEPGPPCACGRGLPVLRQIAGRARNMALLPDGSRFWPRIRPGEWARVATVTAFRLVQTAVDAMRLEIVTAHALQPEQAAALAAIVVDGLGHPYRVSVVRVDRISRGAAEKLDDFVCEVRQ